MPFSVAGGKLTAYGNEMETNQEIVETPAYIKQATRIGLTAAEMVQIKLYLSENPEAGDIIRGSGGVRKVRFARQNTGKSGGVRLFTFFWTVDAPLFIMWVIAKTKQDNISQDTLNALNTFAKELKNG